MTDVIKTLFDKVANGVVAKNPGETGLNGAGGLVDLVTPTSHVAESMFIVLNANHVMNVTASIAYSLHIAQGKPDADTDVTKAHLEAAMPFIGAQLARYTMLDFLAHVTPAPPIAYRASDIVTDEQYKAYPNNTKVRAYADLIMEGFAQSSSFAARIIINSQYATYAVFANAIHRAVTQGHNWFTDATKKLGSQTNKIIALAGSARDEFSDFMSDFGHDLWHFLSDKSLSDVANVLSGITEARVNSGYKYNGYTFNTAATKVNEVVRLTQSVTDRWPIGTLGISSAILGCDALAAMMTQISSRCTEFNDQKLIAAIGKLKAHMSDTTVTRQALLSLRAKFAPMVGLAYGFASKFQDSADFFAKYKSIVELAKGNHIYVTQGELLGKWIKEKDMSDEGMNALLTTSLKNLANEVNAINDDLQVANVDNVNADAIVVRFE